MVKIYFLELLKDEYFRQKKFISVKERRLINVYKYILENFKDMYFIKREYYRNLKRERREYLKK